MADLTKYGCKGEGSFGFICKKRETCLRYVAYQRHIEQEKRRDYDYAICSCDFVHQHGYEFFQEIPAA